MLLPKIMMAEAVICFILGLGLTIGSFFLAGDSAYAHACYAILLSWQIYAAGGYLLWRAEARQKDADAES